MVPPPPPTALGKILRNSAWGILGLALGAPLNFVVTILLARGLTTRGFGAFEAIFAYCGVIQIFAEGGLSTVLVRRIATDRESAARHLAEAKSLIWILTVGAFAGGVLFALWRAPSYYLPAAVILLAATLVTVHAMVHVAVFRAFEEMGWNAAGFVLQKVLNVALLVLLVWLPQGASVPVRVSGAAISLLVANLALLTFYARAVKRRHLPDARPVYDPAAWWSLTREAVLLGLGRTLRKITWQVDTLLLPLLAGLGATGIYRAAYRPLFFFNWIPFVVAIPLFPHLSRLAETDRGELALTYTKALKFMAIVSLPTSAALTAVAEPVIVLFFGAEYLASVPAFQVLIWSVNFLFLTSVFPFLFTALRANRFYAYVMGLGLGVNLVLDLLLIPIMGVMGACWATLVAEAVMFVTGWIGFRVLKFGVPLLPGVGVPALMSVGVGVGLWWARHLPVPLLAVLVAATALIYLALLWLSGAVTPDEIQALRRAVQRRRDKGELGAVAVDRELVDTGSAPR
jgi:O-antigen/teichoic acid export membrane protein